MNRLSVFLFLKKIILKKNTLMRFTTIHNDSYENYEKKYYICSFLSKMIDYVFVSVCFYISRLPMNLYIRRSMAKCKEESVWGKSKRFPWITFLSKMKYVTVVYKRIRGQLLALQRSCEFYESIALKNEHNYANGMP